MAKPEEGEGLVIPEKQLSPTERIKRAKDAIETGRNLGIALDLVAQLETLVQYAEKNPETDGARSILSNFENYERALRAFQLAEEEAGKAGGDWKERESKKRELEMAGRGVSDFLKTMAPHIFAKLEREQEGEK